MFVAGIDIGSISAETVIVDIDEKKIKNFNIMPTGFKSKEIAEKSFNKALADMNLKINDIDYIVSTGYGRDNVFFADKQISEITAHAMGAKFLFPDAKTILDVGGQDSKAISLDSEGNIADFIMNDKCAAGTGRFLEVMANVLGAKLSELGELSLESENIIPISNMCAVFAESEVISLIHEGYTRQDISKGIHEAIADRSIGFLNKVGINNSVILTGGVAKNIGFVEAIKNKLYGFEINIPEEPQILGALGASLSMNKVKDKIRKVSKVL
ncbi:acyl-CoA dehydratase activase [bacterium]